MCFGLARVQPFASNVGCVRKAVANDDWCSLNTVLWTTRWQIEDWRNDFGVGCIVIRDPTSNGGRCNRSRSSLALDQSLGISFGNDAIRDV